MIATKKDITATEARANLYQLIDQVASLHQPVHIQGKRNSAMLVSEADWASVMETLYLLSMPKMRASITKGLKTPVEKCIKELKW